MTSRSPRTTAPAPPTHPPWPELSWRLPALALAGFLVLLGLVAAGWPPLDRFDAGVSDAFRRYGDVRPGAITLLRIATDAAATPAFVLAGAVATLFALTRGHRQAAVLCGLVTLAVPVLWGLMHWLIHHPRPVDNFVMVTSNSFPSGHSSNAAAAAIVLVLFCWPGRRRLARVAVVLLAAGFAVGIGFTRVALLAHWPTDVLGGWLLALAVVPGAARLATRLSPR